ncbi:hypothetical protein TNCV_3308971 [Trichonephila clavipes]|nr:hypothetical protein TNCV_3308971 [Trichonephila clavipes]
MGRKRKRSNIQEKCQKLGLFFREYIAKNDQESVLDERNMSAKFKVSSFHDFGDNFKLQEQLSGGSVVVVHEEPHPQMTGTLSYRPEETGGREKSLDTRHRRLDDRYRVLPWPEDCTVVVCLHDALYGVCL